MYYEIQIKLTKNQILQLVDAIENKTRLTLTFKPRQIDHDEGTRLLVTEAQLKKINLGLETNQNVTIAFTITQLQTMLQEMMTGSGILQSIGNFFSKAVSGVKNAFTSKPQQAPAKYKDYDDMYMTQESIGRPKMVYTAPKPKPQKTTFDRIAKNVNKFDGFIDKIFSY